MTKPWIVDDAGTLINMETRETYDYVSDLVDVLNNQEETIQDLKTRNNRQYDLLKKITDYMYARDWKALEQIVVEWEEADRLLKAEFKCCNGGDVQMTENKRVTVDFDSESYYLDGEYWESWDNYGEEMADEINKLLDKQDKIIKDKERLNKAKNQQLEDAKQILKSEMKYACKQKQEYINDPYVYQAYNIIEYGLIKTLDELGWDSE